MIFKKTDKRSKIAKKIENKKNRQNEEKFFEKNVLENSEEVELKKDKERENILSKLL